MFWRKYGTKTRNRDHMEPNRRHIRWPQRRDDTLLDRLLTGIGKDKKKNGEKMKKELNRDEMEKYFDQKYDGWVCDCGIVSTTILMICDKSTKTSGSCFFI